MACKGPRRTLDGGTHHRDTDRPKRPGSGSRPALTVGNERGRTFQWRAPRNERRVGTLFRLPLISQQSSTQLKRLKRPGTDKKKPPETAKVSGGCQSQEAERMRLHAVVLETPKSWRTSATFGAQLGNSMQYDRLAVVLLKAVQELPQRNDPGGCHVALAPG